MATSSPHEHCARSMARPGRISSHQMNKLRPCIWSCIILEVQNKFIIYYGAQGCRHGPATDVVYISAGDCHSSHCWDEGALKPPFAWYVPSYVPAFMSTTMFFELSNIEHIPEHPGCQSWKGYGWHSGNSSVDRSSFTEPGTIFPM